MIKMESAGSPEALAPTYQKNTPSYPRRQKS